VTKEQFAESMNRLMGFYDKPLNEIQQKTWYDIFAPYDQRDFDSSIRMHIKTSEDPRFPALAIIYKATKGWVMG
jgi:hypothetical protein